MGPPPKSMRVLWTLLGHEPPKGVQRRTVRQGRWRDLLRRAPLEAAWLKSPQGLRAPPRWSPRVEDAFYELKVPISPLAFAAACFPGRMEIAAGYTSWRGMPELCAEAHGWELEPEEVEEALHAVRALCTHLPFLVYALSPSFQGIALPASGKGMRARLIERQEFIHDPLGRAAWEWKHAIDAEVWSPGMIKAQPRTPWQMRSRMVPCERSLVEGGYRGWRLKADSPHASLS